MTEPSKTVANERIKLSATILNGIALATIVAGFVTPLVATSFGMQGPLAIGSGLATLVAIAWLAADVGLHAVARKLLGGLRE